MLRFTKKKGVEIIKLPFEAGKKSLTFQVQDTTRNLIKISALRDGLLISSDRASNIVSPSGKIVKTRYKYTVTFCLISNVTCCIFAVNNRFK